MKALFAAIAIVLASLAPAAAQQAEAREVQGVISSQIEAFRADDFDTAFTFASPNIQRIFGNSARFEMMVKQGYPMVVNPATTRFLDLRTVAGRVWQKVLVRDASGRGHVLDYQMVPGEGGWKINGVQILPASDPTA